jgi:hypothetical protein
MIPLYQKKKECQALSFALTSLICFDIIASQDKTAPKRAVNKQLNKP